MFGKRPVSPDSAPVSERLRPAPRPATQPPAPPAPPPQGGPARSHLGLGAPVLGAPTPGKSTAGPAGPPQQVPTAVDLRRSDTYYETKGAVFGALIEAIDLGQLAKLDADSAREEIRDIVNEIIAIKNIVMSIAEQEDLLDDICNDVLGYGPLEPLRATRSPASCERLWHGLYRSRKSAARFRRPVSGFATISSGSTFVSVSSARSAGASIIFRLSAMRACLTARGSTPSCRRLPSTGRRSPTANSLRTSCRPSNWSATHRSRRKAPRSSRRPAAAG